MSFDLKAIISTVAPSIATMLGGPLAGTAVNAGLRALGIAPEKGNEEQQLAEAMASASPEDLLKLKKADQAFKVKLKEIGIEAEKIAADDRSDARAREVATGDNSAKVLAIVVVAGFFSVLYTIAFVAIPAPAQQAINILLGALTAMLTQVGNYYFGSSASSARKTEMINQAPAAK